jgi:hypothetical protein
MASKPNNSASHSLKQGEKSEKQLAFEREAREKLENADMKAFDRMMKTLVNPKKRAGTESGPLG